MNEENSKTETLDEKPKRKKYGGRRPGSKNKITLAIREAVIQTFAQLGGVDHMRKWAKKNPTEFYRIASKLIPQEISHSGSVEVKSVEVVVLNTQPTNGIHANAIGQN